MLVTTKPTAAVSPPRVSAVARSAAIATSRAQTGVAGLREPAWAADGKRLGYIHMRPFKDGVTDEPCGYVSLLALTEGAEGKGIAHLMMQAAETWARAQGYRFLCLDVFADNRHAVEFYERRGFQTETLRMVKPL